MRSKFDIFEIKQNFENRNIFVNHPQKQYIAIATTAVYSNSSYVLKFIESIFVCSIIEFIYSFRSLEHFLKQFYEVTYKRYKNSYTTFISMFNMFCNIKICI